MFLCGYVVSVGQAHARERTSAFLSAMRGCVAFLHLLRV